MSKSNESIWLEYTSETPPQAVMKGFESEEEECVATLLHGIPDEGGSATKHNFEMLVRMAFQGGLVSAKRKIEEATDQRDNAVREMDACHRCWNDFTAKLGAVAPAIKNAPLFQQAEHLVALIKACEAEQWQHDIGQERGTECACRVCVTLKKLKGS